MKKAWSKGFMQTSCCHSNLHSTTGKFERFDMCSRYCTILEYLVSLICWQNENILFQNTSPLVRYSQKTWQFSAKKSSKFLCSKNWTLLSSMRFNLDILLGHIWKYHSKVDAQHSSTYSFSAEQRDQICMIEVSWHLLPYISIGKLNFHSWDCWQQSAALAFSLWMKPMREYWCCDCCYVP